MQVSPNRPPFEFDGMIRTETRLSPFIRNAEATLVELLHGQTILPIIIPDVRPGLPPSERCWTTCLESAVVGYVLDEWRAREQPRGLKALAGNLLATLSSCGPWRRAIQVGSLPFSTTVRPDETTRMIWDLLPALRREMPERPFAVRHVMEGDLPEELPAEAVKLPVRLVYVQDFKDGIPPCASAWKRDVGKLRRSGLIQIGDREFDAARIDEVLELYRLVYRNKYSRRHPEMTAGFIAMARERGWITFSGLVDPVDRRLLAFSAEHGSSTTVSVPFLGHDTSLPKAAALYRQTCAMVTLGTVARRLVENSSSGCGDFKRNRQFIPTLEYLIVFPALAGPRRVTDRAVLALIGAAARKVGVQDMLDAGG